MADQATTTASVNAVDLGTTNPAGTPAPAAPAAAPLADAKAPKPLSAAQRADAALAKLDVKDKPTEKKPPEAEAEADKPTEKKPPEATKPEEPRISRGLAILAAREEKVRAAEAALKSHLAETETRLAADAQDIQTVRSVREAQKTGGLAAALKVLGIDLRTGIEELSRTHAEPTPEEIARRVAGEEWEARQKAHTEQAEKAEREKAERAQASDLAEGQAFFEKAATICGPLETTDYPRVVANSVSAQQFWTLAKSMRQSLGRSVQPAEVLAEAEKILKGREDVVKQREQARAAKAAPAAPPPPKQTPAEPENKQSRRQRDRAPSPSERAEAAMKRLGIH